MHILRYLPFSTCSSAYTVKQRKRNINKPATSLYNERLQKYLSIFLPPTNMCGFDGGDHPKSFLAIRIASYDPGSSPSNLYSTVNWFPLPFVTVGFRIIQLSSPLLRYCSYIVQLIHFYYHTKRDTNRYEDSREW